MRFATHTLATLAALAALVLNNATAGEARYRCTDETGLVLLTSDAGAANICKLLSAADRTCPGKQCSITITKDLEGRLYINGTANGIPVRYPVDRGASAVTVCIRGRCKAQ